MVDSDLDLIDKFQRLATETSSGGEVQSTSDWEPVISIGTAAKLVGLSVSALRKYEKEGFLMYHRSETGRRLLCRADIRRIEKIKHMINEIGLNIEGIRRLLALLPCWELKQCSMEDRKRCVAVRDIKQPCWMINRTQCRKRDIDCRLCEVYRYGIYCAITMKLLVREIDDIGG